MTPSRRDASRNSRLAIKVVFGCQDQVGSDGIDPGQGGIPVCVWEDGTEWSGTTVVPLEGIFRPYLRLCGSMYFAR